MCKIKTYRGYISMNTSKLVKALLYVYKTQTLTKLKTQIYISTTKAISCSNFMA